MKAFIWWLRSAFCKHEWKERGVSRIYWHGEDGKKLTDLPNLTMSIKECQKCGWIWRQRL